MTKKPKFDPSLHDENPEWTEEDFAGAKPAFDMPETMLSFFKKTRAKFHKHSTEFKKISGE